MSELKKVEGEQSGMTQAPDMRKVLMSLDELGWITVGMLRECNHPMVSPKRIHGSAVAVLEAIENVKPLLEDVKKSYESF